MKMLLIDQALPRPPLAQEPDFFYILYECINITKP